jgi:hypothetical protein
LKRLRYAKPKGTNIHLVYADLGKGPMIPFTQLGQAFTRTLEIYCEIFANQPKIILIDEIENGLYYEGMADFWKGLFAVLEDQESLFLEAAKHTHAEIFPCIENFVQCIEAARGDTLHEKSRFFIWSIVAQGPGPKDRLSLDRAIKHLPPDWNADAFAGLRKMLEMAAS